MPLESFYRRSEANEVRILIACARRELTAAQARQVSNAVARGIDWESLWESARRHGIGYFVGQHLQQLLSNPPALEQNLDLPATFLPRMQQQIRSSSARALIHSNSQCLVAAEFERQGIPGVWLKGLSLSERLYGRFDARSSSDLDLLVELSSFDRAEDCLEKLGWKRGPGGQPSVDSCGVGSHHRVWYSDAVKDWQVVLELHHRVSGPKDCQPDMPELIRRSRPVQLRGQQIAIPALEDELLLLCLHAHQHNFRSLRCLMDVAEFVQRYRREVDWPRFLARAQSSRGRGRVVASLVLAAAVLGLGSESDVLDLLPRLTLLQRWAVPRRSSAVKLAAEIPTDVFRSARLAILMDGWSDTVKQLQYGIVPNREYIHALCPASLARWPGFPYVHYLWRTLLKHLRGSRRYVGGRGTSRR